MATGGSKAPAAPDPQRIIELQSQYNRYNQNSPFGSVNWSRDANGHETANTTPSAQMQGAIDRAFGLSATPSQQMYVPQGMDQLASAILGRVGARYGLGNANPNNPTIGFGAQGGNSPMASVYGVGMGGANGGPAQAQPQGGALNTNLKQAYQSPQPPRT